MELVLTLLIGIQRWPVLMKKYMKKIKFWVTCPERSMHIMVEHEIHSQQT